MKATDLIWATILLRAYPDSIAKASLRGTFLCFIALTYYSRSSVFILRAAIFIAVTAASSPLLPYFPAGPVNSLLTCFRCQNPENKRDIIIKIKLCDALCNSLAYISEMGCFSTELRIRDKSLHQDFCNSAINRAPKVNSNVPGT